MRVPHSLRTWFLIHFIADYAFAIPLFLAPRTTLQWLGFDVIDPFATRLVAAALFGIGGVSLLMRHGDAEAFSALLSLKIIWSVAAIVGMIITLIEGGPAFGYFAIAVFSVFSAAWVYYKVQFLQRA